jgi:hypothetical protein
MPRTLSEAEFEALKARVLASAPPNLASEDEFNRWAGPAFAQAIGEAEHSPEPTTGGATGRFLSNLGEKLNPVTAVKGMYQMARHPLSTYEGAVDAAAQQFRKAGDAYQEGRYSEAVGHGLAGAVPFVGPAAAEAGEQIGRGDVAGGVGSAAGLVVPFGVPAAARAVGRVTGRATQALRSPGPSVATGITPEALAFARAREIPLSVADVSDNLAARGVQGLVDRGTLGGAAVATKAKATQAAALERTGAELAGEIHPAPVTVEQAGTAIRESPTQLIRDLNTAADEGYAKLRAIEAEPQHLRTVNTAPMGTPAFQRLWNKLRDGAPGAEPLQIDEARAMRQLEVELEAQPYTKGKLVTDLKDPNLATHYSRGSAGTPVYDEILQAAPGTADLSRAEVQRAIRTTLETGEWTNASRGALQVARQKLATRGLQGGPQLPPNQPLIGSSLKVPLPVLLQDVKQALQPIYASLADSNATVGLMGDKATAFVKLKNLMQGPDAVSVSVADDALGTLKTLARADMPELRTAGQGVAAAAVKELHAAVDRAVAQAGPRAVQALEQGRASTIAKYQVAETLDLLKTEPVRTVQALTVPKDAAIVRLRQLRDVAPMEMEKLGRAYFEDLLTKTQAVADWRKLGPATKEILVSDPALRRSIDQFFEVRDRISKTKGINPSESGYMASLAAQGGMVLANPMGVGTIQLGAAALATLLRSKVAVDALTAGLQLPVSAPAKARALVAARLVKAAAQAGVALPETRLPLAAQGGQRPADGRGLGLEP